jgi:hypothetical protein
MLIRTAIVGLVFATILLGGCGTSVVSRRSNPLFGAATAVADGAKSLFSRTAVVELGDPQRELIKNSAGQVVDVQFAESTTKARIQDPTYSGFLTDLGAQKNRELQKLLDSLERTDVASPTYAYQARKAALLREVICQAELAGTVHVAGQMDERVQAIDQQKEMLGAAAPASLTTRRNEAEALKGWLERVGSGYRNLLDSSELNEMDDLSIPRASATYLASAGK